MIHPNLKQQKTHLENLNKRLKSNGCDAVYMACMIGQCLTELTEIYHGNKKLSINATKTFVCNKLCVFFR